MPLTRQDAQQVRNRLDSIRDSLNAFDRIDLQDAFEEVNGFLSKAIDNLPDSPIPQAQPATPAQSLYHFNVGDADTMGVGFCALVQADNEQAAVEILQGVLDGMNQEFAIYDIAINESPPPPAGLKYLRVYFGHKVDDEMIDQVDDTQ